LIFLVQGNKFDSEKRIQPSSTTAIIPLVVSGRRVKIVDPYDFHIFGSSSVERIVDIAKSAKGIGRMKMSIHIGHCLTSIV
jgi:hypothetical protein